MRLWYRLARGPSAPVVASSILVGALYAVHDEFELGAIRLILALLGGMSGTLGGMILAALIEVYLGAEPVDASAGVEHFRGHEVVSSGLLGAKQAAAAGALLVAAALACGLALVPHAGSIPVALGFAALLVTAAYTIPDFGLRDLGRGLGELAGFVVFGALPVIGGYVALSGRVTFGSFLASLPLGFTGAAIVFAHHLERHVKTRGGTPGLIRELGEDRALWVGPGLVILAQVAVLGNVLGGEYPPWCLLSLATVPVAAWKRAADGDPREATRMTGLLHALGAVLVAAGFAVSALTA